MSNEILETTVALLGYGTASVNAAIGLRCAGYAGDIHVFTDTNTRPYSPILTSHYASGRKTYEQCFPWSDEELDELNLTVHYGTPVTHLDPDQHKIVTPSGEFSYQKCVICTGARPSLAGFPEVKGYRPLVLRTLDDAQALKDRLADANCKRVLVSGASMVAIKAAETCIARHKETHLVGMREHILDMSAVPQVALRFEQGMNGKGVQLHLGQTIAQVRVLDEAARDEADALRATCERVLEVTFSNGEKAVFDEIIVAHGVRAQLGFLDVGALNQQQGLIVDGCMRTSNPDIFAAGDVAQATDRVSGEKEIAGIWKTAAVQGQCAGAAVAADLEGVELDPKEHYGGSLVTNTIRMGGVVFMSGGRSVVAPGRAVELRERDDLLIALITDEVTNTLIGFNVVSDKDQAGGRVYDTGAMLALRLEKVHAAVC